MTLRNKYRGHARSKIPSFRCSPESARQTLGHLRKQGFTAQSSIQVYVNYISTVVQVKFALGDMDLHERKAIYDSANIVYVTAPTLAFDYLKDSTAMDASLVSLPTLGFAIIDEVDQILIDNAINPFIISSPAPFWNNSTEERIRQAIAVAQGMVLKQLSLAEAAAAASSVPQANQTPQLQEALDGVIGDSSAALDPRVQESTLIEIKSFAQEHLGMVPSPLYALFNTLRRAAQHCGCWDYHSLVYLIVRDTSIALL